MRLSYLSSLIGLLSLPAMCQAADVTGTVSLAGHGTGRLAVVWLEGAKRSTPLPHAVVDQRQKTFLPHVSVVTVGTTVQFPNNDNVFHNVFAYYDAKKFDLGMYPRGASRSVTLDKKGVVALLCNVHSEMSAYIIVVDTPYFAVCDRQGRFALKDIPPGEYTVHVWHESGASLSKPIRVSGDAPLNLTASK